MKRFPSGLLQDRQYKIYVTFLLAFCLALLLLTLLFGLKLTDSVKTMLISHDETIASSLIEQGVSEQIIAKALMSDDYAVRLPQNGEGAVYQMFSSIDKLATMLQAQNEAAHQSKVFLRNTISDISHQLKTPLAALSMYQEIMENEPDQPDVIRTFTAKTALSLKRMEQLIGSMLKITRLDAGAIVFKKQPLYVQELIAQSVNELTTRAANEQKAIVLKGSPDDTLSCDPAWTCEAIGNLVKNALDHTAPQDTVCIAWDTSPFTTRIQVSDNGEGIFPEDIHHIFKRFYRSRHSTDTPGIGLGLSLAKSIVEGQGGTISVQSTPHVGTKFTILFPV